MDLNYTRDTTSGNEGLDLLTRIQAIDSILPVVVMTAWGSVKLAVEAMRRGARDFIQKPWENERLITIVRTQIELRNALRRGMRLEAENRLLRTETDPRARAYARGFALQRDARLYLGVLGSGRAGIDYTAQRCISIHDDVLVQDAAVDVVVCDEDGLGHPAIPPMRDYCKYYQLDLPIRTDEMDRSVDTEWVLFTSGTTGRPKMAVHTLASLTGPLDDRLAVTSGAM